MKSRGLVLLATAWLVVAAPAHAQDVDLEAARSAFYDASFRRARELFTAILASPTLTRETATEAYRFLATIELLLRHSDEARGHATRAVALDPSVEPPEGSSSRAGRLFAEAREALDGARLRLRIESSTSDDGGPIVTARLTPDVADLVARVRLRCSRSDDEPARTAESSVAESREAELSLPEGRRRWSCAATAETASGAVLVRAVHRTSRSAPPRRGDGDGDGDGDGSSSSGSGGGRRGRDDDSGLPLWPFLVGGGAVVIGAVVVIVAVAAGGGGDDRARIELGPIDVPAWR